MSLPSRRLKPLFVTLTALLMLLLAFGAVAQRAEPTRTVDVPRRLNEIRRDLRFGQLWVAQSGERLNAMRVSLELDNRVVGNVTLQPGSGQPVPFQERNNQRLERLPTEALLTAYLRGLRQDAQGMRFGAYLLPSPRGLEVQVYWSGKLVSYLYVDPSSGGVATDEVAMKELASSSLRVR
jgi:hypothetical protein